MKLGIWAPRGGAADEDDIDDAYRFSVEIVRKAESMGFVTTLVAQRLLGQDLDAWVLAPALATQTSSIELLLAVHPGVIPAQMVSKMGATLDRLSNGRFAVNIVNGWFQKEMEICGNGAWLDFTDDRYDRMDEYIQVMKGLWITDNYSFRGKYYNVDQSPVRFETVTKPWPPIYTASRSNRGKEIIARECDWWFADCEAGYRNFEKNIAAIARYVEDMNARAASYGRKLRYGISATAICEDTQEKAEAQALALEEARLHIREGRSAIAALGAGLVGTPDEIAARMRRYEDIGVECFMLRFPHQSEGLDTFGRRVLPLIEDRLEAPPLAPRRMEIA